jgi:DNA-binding MarR family transcriptional regulator
MKAIDRWAAEFRALQEGIIARLRNLNLTAMGDLSMTLTVQEFRSLEFLASAEPRKTKELAEYLGLAVNSVTDVVDALEQKGLARRRRDDADRRVVRVELTGAGRVAAETVARGHLDIPSRRPTPSGAGTSATRGTRTPTTSSPRPAGW